MADLDELLGFCSAEWGAHHEHLCCKDRGHELTEDDPIHECDCQEQISDAQYQEDYA